MANIGIDRDFVRVGSKSYATRKINSVEVRQQQTNAGKGVIALLLGAMAAFLFLFAMFMPHIEGTAVTLCLCALFAWPAVSLARRPPAIQHQLYLMTSSGEAQALSSRDGDEIARLAAEIEAAMIEQPHMRVEPTPRAGEPIEMKRVG